MNTPLPIANGIASNKLTGTTVQAHFLKHDANAGETPADDCFITTPIITNPLKLDDGEKMSGQSGLWSPADFHLRFQFAGGAK